MASDLKATVTQFREGKDSNGEPVTLYVLAIQSPSTPLYTLSKRYSDFAHIYSLFKDLLPNEYRFPNKSLFNNASQFTKERRLRGFQELLDLLLKYHPHNEKVSEFLRFNPKAVGAPTQSSTLKSSKDLDVNNPNVSDVSNEQTGEGAFEAILRRKLGILTHYVSKTHEEHTQVVKTTTHAENKKEELIKLLQNSAIGGVGAYLLLISIRIIDVGQQSIPQLVYTAVTFVVLIAHFTILDKMKSVS
jgi:hypothetical protein